MRLSLPCRAFSEAPRGRERKVDGLITINLALTPKQLKYFKKNGLAIVNLEAEMTSLADEQLRYEATEKLLEKTYAQLRTSIREK